MDDLSFNLTPCHVSLPYIMGFDIKINHQWIQTTCLPTSCCHQCNYCRYYIFDFVLFHNVTCYTNSLSSRIHVTTTWLFNIMCTLVATNVVLWSLECISSKGFTKEWLMRQQRRITPVWVEILLVIPHWIEVVVLMNLILLMRNLIRLVEITQIL